MEGGLSGVIRPLNELLNEGLIGLISSPGFQINNYTGNPFFLLPLIELLGYSPNAVRITLITTVAASTAILFLCYCNIFDYRKAVLGISLLFTMKEYIYFRWFDYSYTIFLAVILFYLYIKWNESGASMQSFYLYPITFFGGLFFYFKATILYVLAGFGISAIAEYKKRILNAKISILLILFILGSAPFIIHNLSQMDRIENSIAKSNDVSIGGESKNIGIPPAILGRIDQLGRWIYSDVYNLERIDSVGTHDYFGYKFDTFRSPGGRIYEAPNLSSIITGKNYDRFHYSGFHPFSVALILSLISLIYLREYLEYVLIIPTILVLLIFLPSTSGFGTAHMTILVPFIPLIYLAAIDLIPDKWETTKSYQTFYFLILAVLFVSIGATVFTLSPSGNPSNPDIAPLNWWGGDQKFYNEFRRIETKDTIYTNSYRVNVIYQYIRDTDAIFITPKDVSFQELTEKPYTGGHWIGVAKRDNLKNLNPSEDATIILRRDLPCVPVKEFCGAKGTSIINKTGTNVSNLNKLTIDGEDYLYSKE